MKRQGEVHGPRTRAACCAIYKFELARFGRTVWTSLMLPVITTSLYFVVFGSAIGIADERRSAACPMVRSSSPV
jgi:hypothetical protein